MASALIIIMGLLLDQGSKFLIRAFMDLYETVPVINGFFDIYYVTNSGGAWSILADHTWILTMVSLLMVTVMVRYMVFSRDQYVKMSLSLIISGALGNLIDRVWQGKVVDFLAFDIFGYDFPTFNIADILVVCGTIFLCVYIIFFFDKAEKRRQEQDEAEVAALKGQA
ncbi:MAG: signal peptidase II [Clostridia bacterium]|nr:signal peptidase II [Clostridia bacterium]